MKFLRLDEVDSTNSYVSRHAADLDDMTMVIADSQTAGRGQRGNSWESEPGRNLTFSLFFRPAGIEAREQFAISEATALAVVDFLTECGINAMVKWPNDIYVGDRKISGILIEHALMGRGIEHSRIGVGLNVNQRGFVSDAPNPVSMALVTGADTDPDAAAVSLAAALEQRLAQTSSPEGREALHDGFMKRLWRGDRRPYPFRDCRSGRVFNGVIDDVSPFGPISVRDAETGSTSEYAFKEIEFLL